MKLPNFSTLDVQQRKFRIPCEPTLTIILSLKSLAANLCSHYRWEHESWDLPLYMNSSVLCPKYDKDTYMATLLEG